VIELEKRHLKRYPHFDLPLKMSDALRLVNSPDAVKSHPFYPFIVDEKKYLPYRTPRDSTGKIKARPKLKIRPIRSTARGDAAIYAAYRQLLSTKYEQYLERNGLAACVTAYRSISLPSGCGGKSNIHHAHEVFKEIADLGDCVALSLDISSFFENIDHQLLKNRWCDVLGVASLPADHFAVFKNITRYSWIDRSQLYKALGLVTECEKRGKKVEIPMRRDIPMVLCTGKELKKLHEAAKLHGERLIKENPFNRGIPQGSPISDILANLYLIEFDKALNNIAQQHGGIYRRYSDDIILILPGDLKLGSSVGAQVRKEIKNHGSHLKIKSQKTHTIAFTKVNDEITFINSKANKRNVQGLEYLGFRFDGKKVYFRDSTLARHRRKVRKLVKKEAKSVVKRYINKTHVYVGDSFNTQAVMQAVGRTPAPKHFAEVRKQSFHSYTHKATAVFGAKWGSELFRALDYKTWVRNDKDKYLDRYYRAEVRRARV